MRPTVVVVDTTEFRESLKLDRAGWPQLLAWVRAGIVSGAVPDVVLLEANRHFTRQRQDELQRLTQAAKRLQASKAVAHLDLDVVSTEIVSEIAGYLNWVRSELAGNGFELWPIPAVSHKDVLARDLAEKKPFSPIGKGYRDALIWESILEHLPLDQADAVVLLVTRDSGDFATKEGLLDRALAAEAADKGGEVIRVESLKAAIDLLREEAEVELAELLGDAQSALEEDNLTTVVTDAVLFAAEQLAGTAIADNRHATPTTGLEIAVPEDIEDPEVTDVDVQPGSVILDVYDRYEGDTLAVAVSVDAMLTIEGFIYKADYYAGLEDDVEILDDDWNDHMMHVQIERDVRLRFNVLTVANQVENITFDAAEAV